MTFIIYLLTRLFVPKKEEYLYGDEVRHLGTAENFYKFWNKDFYDFHPPLYSLLVRVLAKLGLEYISAGVLVSFLSSIGLFWVCSQLYLRLGLPPSRTQIALLFLSFNYLLIFYSNRIFRYQLFCLLFTTAFLFLIKNDYLLCGVFWGLASLTCGFAGLKFFWVWLAYSFFKELSLLPFLGFVPIYGLWLYAKYKLYKSRKYHPSGPEGKLDLVNPFNLRQLISPMYFPFNYSYYGKSMFRKDLKNWHKKIGGVFGLFLGKFPKYDKIISASTVIVALLTIRGMVNSELWLSIITICLLWSSVNYKYNPRNSIAVIPLLGYFLAKCFPLNQLEWVYFAFFGVALPLLFLKSTLIVRRLLEPKFLILTHFVASLPKDGVIACSGVDYFLAYGAGKRVVSLSDTPDYGRFLYETKLAIKTFELNYIVTDSYTLFNQNKLLNIIDNYLIYEISSRP